MDVLLAAFLGVGAAVELGLRRRDGLRALAWPAGLGFVALILVLLSINGGFGREKVLARLIMPAGLFWLSLAALAYVEARRRSFGRAALLGVAFVAFATLGSVPVGGRLVRSLEARIPAADPEARYEAIFVLGGGTGLSPGRRPQLGAAGDRLRLAARLWHEGRARTLVASGFSPPPYGLGKLSAHTVELWGQMGVPVEATCQLDFPKNTREEIAAYVELAKQEGWTRMGLISSAWHLPRAMALAGRAGLNVTPIPADHLSGPAGELHALWLIPQRAGFSLVDIFAWETLGRWLGR